jgi:hypothetical protein
LRSRDYPTVYRDAKNRKICTLCKRPADSFHDESSKLEYSISAICQHCQDILFKRSGGIEWPPTGSD